jgi:hypothetical protein
MLGKAKHLLITARLVFVLRLSLLVLIFDHRQHKVISFSFLPFDH